MIKRSQQSFLRKALIGFGFVLLTHFSMAQTYYVDPQTGHDSNNGTKAAALKTLKAALNHCNQLTGAGNITIVLSPGIYVLEDKLVINPVRMFSDSTRFTIKALHNPDDEEWTPEHMPVVQSISANNSKTQFDHTTGFLVASSHVTFEGLKFLGNPNPNVRYYYPISKENPNLEDLEVTQCIFIGDKEAAQIQGGVWAHGRKNKVSHCVFLECRNAVLFFNNIDYFSITHTIIQKSYESAFWFGAKDVPFTFHSNVLSYNENVMVFPKGLAFTSPFSNSCFYENRGEVGYWSRTDSEVIQDYGAKVKLENIKRNVPVKLIENKGVSPSHNHLTLANTSQELGFGAGIFKNATEQE
ncbi:MAG: hypothetical protein AAGL29_02170 [Bacteroidota bacterium]